MIKWLNDICDLNLHFSSKLFEIYSISKHSECFGMISQVWHFAKLPRHRLHGPFSNNLDTDK